MNLIGEHVSHPQFGAGIVSEQTETAVSVDFGGNQGVKKFLYPTAFKSFLNLSNAAAQEKIANEIRKIEAKQRQDEKRAEKRRREEEDRALRQQKLANAKKRSASKA
jgi:DNA gyrase/topoisomerase IV subunit B